MIRGCPLGGGGGGGGGGGHRGYPTSSTQFGLKETNLDLPIL